MKRSKVWPVTLLGVLGLVLLSLLPKITYAHPLDQFVLSSYLTVTPQQIAVEIDLTPGVLLAPQFLPILDSNNDQQISEAESQTYAALVLKDIELTVDAKPQSLILSRVEMAPYLNLQTGYGTIKLYTQAALTGEVGTTGVTHQVFYKNNYQPTNPAYQVNANLDGTVPVTVGPQNRDAIQQSVTMTFTIAAAGLNSAATPTTPAAAVTGLVANSASVTVEYSSGNPEGLQQIFDFLYQPELSVWVLLLALGLAVLLGGLHALTPGHGKTMVAAYLVGSRGTAKHAIALGGIVTFTHTISVIGIGLVALLASQFIVPTVLVPVLESIAGILVISLGIRLFWTRWRWAKGSTTGSDHTHVHDHGNSHDHDHTHSHENGAHSHMHGPLPEKIRPGDLIAMGISGGLVPCPEALGILVIAVGLNRIGLGLGLIVAFSLGVALVLIGIGLLLVHARGLLDRVSSRGKGWQRWLPLVSAGIVTAIGMVMVFNGLKNYPLVLAIGSLVAVVSLGGVWLCLRMFRTETPHRHPETNLPLAQPKPAKSGLGEKVS